MCRDQTRVGHFEQVQAKQWGSFFNCDYRESAAVTEF